MCGSPATRLALASASLTVASSLWQRNSGAQVGVRFDDKLSMQTVDMLVFLSNKRVVSSELVVRESRYLAAGKALRRNSSGYSSIGMSPLAISGLGLSHAERFSLHLSHFSSGTFSILAALS